MVQAIVGGWQFSCGASMRQYVDATGSHGCAEQVICGSKQCQMVYVCVGVVMAAASALTAATRLQPGLAVGPGSICEPHLLITGLPIVGAAQHLLASTLPTGAQGFILKGWGWGAALGMWRAVGRALPNTGCVCCLEW
jgi:hypothetical protein